jgi:hypothetical protein
MRQTQSRYFLVLGINSSYLSDSVPSSDAGSRIPKRSISAARNKLIVISFEKLRCVVAASSLLD